MKRWLRAATLALLIALLVAPAVVEAAPRAQPAGLSMSVRIGFDGHYKLGEWFPVQVTLDNTGQAIEAEVRVGAIGDSNDQQVATYARQVSLPSPSRKQVTLYTYSASYQHTILVQLVSGNGVLLQQKVPVDPLNDAFLLCVVSDSSDLLNNLSNTKLGSPASAQAATVAHLTPDALPTSAPALAGLDALVFANTDTSRLSAETRQALAGWVAAGGLLVVGGGATAPATSAGLADLLPATIGGTYTPSTLDPLGTFAGVAAPPAGGAAASALSLRPETGAVALASVDGQPLLASRSLGSGAVLALGLDPTAPPLTTWDKGSALWQQIFSAHAIHLSTGAQRRTNNGNPNLGPYFSGSSFYLGQLSPFDIPVLQLPSVGLVAGFLLIYVVVVGPLNYLVLRRWRRTELAWATIPALILAFAGVAYLIGFQSKGNQLRLNTASIVQTYPGAAVATVNSFVGVFSPNRQSYNVQFAGDVQLSEVNSSGMGGSQANGSLPTIYQGQPSTVAGLNIDTWALRGFLAETTVAYQAPFTGHFQTSGGTISGQLTNSSSTPLEDAAVIIGGAVQRVGALGPGQSAPVQIKSVSGMDMEAMLQQLLPGLQTQTFPPPQGAADRALRRRAALLSTLLSDSQGPISSLNVMLVGWSHQAPFDVQVAGEQAERDDLVLISSPLPVDQPNGQVLLPPMMIPRRVVSGDVGSANKGFPQSTFLTISNDSIFEYRLPTDAHITRLTLNYAQDKNSGSTEWPKIELFNQRVNNWDEVRDPSGQSAGAQTSFTGDMPVPSDYIAKDGTVRLQILVEPSSSYHPPLMIKTLDLSAEGQH